MTARNLLADARDLLAASTTTPDPDLRVLFVGKSRTALVQLRAEVDAFERELAAVEAEIARTAKGSTS